MVLLDLSHSAASRSAIAALCESLAANVLYSLSSTDMTFSKKAYFRWLCSSHFSVNTNFQVCDQVLRSGEVPMTKRLLPVRTNKTVFCSYKFSMTEKR